MDILSIEIIEEKSLFDLNDISEFTPEMLYVALRRYLPISSSNVERLVNDFWENSDHGFSHSQAVWRRCQEIIRESPLLWQLAKIQVGDNEAEAKRVLILASISHDLARFLGAPFQLHEWQSTEIAKKTLIGSSLAYPVCSAIVHHDYINYLVSGYDFPYNVILPLSEIFRLADKTSLSPKDELLRYYATGRRLAPDRLLFDPSITDEVRFDLQHVNDQCDYLTWFLLIFALQSTDFLYGDTRDAYAYWARGKKEALETIGDLCRQEEYLDGRTPADPEEAMAVVVRFCQKNNLIISA